MNGNLPEDARVLTDVRGTLHLEREYVTWTPSSLPTSARAGDFRARSRHHARVVSRRRCRTSGRPRRRRPRDRAHHRAHRHVAHARRARPARDRPRLRVPLAARAVVRAELVAQRVADLADRDARAERLAHRRQQVLRRRPRRGAPRRARRSASSASRSARTRVRPLELPALGRRIDAVQLDLPSSASAKRLTPTITRSPVSTSLVVAERRVLDLALHEALLDRGDRAAELVDALDQLARALLELVRQRLDEERAAERVGGVGRAALGREDLLRAQRDPRRALGRQRERLVEAVRVQALRAAERRPRAPGSRRARCCSPAAARSASSRRSGRGSGAPAPAGSSRRSGRA